MKNKVKPNAELEEDDDLPRTTNYHQQKRTIDKNLPKGHGSPKSKGRIEGHLHEWAEMPVNVVKNGVDTMVKPVMAFKESFLSFIVGRSVVEVAVAFVMGFSFRTICTSIVDDLVSPVISLVITTIFPSYEDAMITEMFWVIRQDQNENNTEYATRAEARAEKALTINFGNFLKVVIDFLILCFALYLFINFFYLRVITKEVNTNPCPQCQEDVKEGAIRCPHCTQLLPEKEGSELQTITV